MNDNELIQKIEKLDSPVIKFAVTDIDGVMRGKIISKKKLLKSLEEGFGFCNVIFGWDINDGCYDNAAISGWHTGYPDAMATVDTTTLRNIPWDNDMPFFIADFGRSKEIAGVCPRSLLKRINHECIALGYSNNFSKEFEWFNFKETPDSLKEKEFTKLQSLTPGMFGYSIIRPSQHQAYYNDIFNLLLKFNVPLEGLHTETGDGVYEACLDYTNILEAADRAVLFKTSVKEIAYRHGLIACFMAKWNSGLPGCSGHIHQSLWNEAGTANLFYDAQDEENMSDLLKHYLAGQLYCMPHILPMYAPTVNSYKRYVEGAWSSTSVSWGIENRTTALRIINHTAEGTRLETRMPGADANPYLSLAASLASGLYGIKNKLPLNIAAVKGSAYNNDSLQKFPNTLKEATEAMKASPIAAELFGAKFTDHFIRTREWEWKQFTQKVTDWELKRYFEIV
ncbi:MAG TPA: glutamine synthetase [Panacibacter sp.]|nr:glutamine synthetase [Panacibacter sp.]